MRISWIASIVLASMLVTALFVACDASLVLEAKDEFTVRNFSTDPIEEVTVRWEGFAEEGFVLRDRSGNTITVPAAPDEETPVEITLVDMNYFPRHTSVMEFTATFKGGRTETATTNRNFVEFAKPVVEVFTSSVRFTNSLEHSITGIALHRDAQPSDPGTGGDFNYVIGLGLPLLGVAPGTGYTINLNSTDESKVRGSFYMYALQADNEGWHYAGIVTTSVGQITEFTVN